MELIYDWEAQAPLQRVKTFFSIGVFDGLHRGHKHIIDMVIKNAAKLKVKSLILTFEPHPLKILAKEAAPPILTTVAQKAEILQQWGLDCLGILKFSKKMADMEPKKFLYQFLSKVIDPVGVVMGPDFSFGKNAAGEADLIKAWLNEASHRGKVTIVEPVAGQTGFFSSSQIRQDLKSGLVESAAQALGRPYRLAGVVIHGQARGRTLGFPTANMGQVSQLIPAPGVYAVQVTVEGQIYGGMTSIGYNPTFGKQPMTVETHIFEFDRFIYGMPLTVDFLSHLRDIIKFNSPEQLTTQLSNDMVRARAALLQLAE